MAKKIRHWLDRASVGTLCIQKGGLWENGYVESFNGRLRDDLLNRELLLSLPEARYVLHERRQDYNHHRPRAFALKGRKEWTSMTFARFP